MKRKENLHWGVLQEKRIEIDECDVQLKKNNGKLYTWKRMQRLSIEKYLSKQQKQIFDCVSERGERS